MSVKVTRDDDRSDEVVAHADSVLRCVGVTKYFGGVRALDDVNVDLNAGEITALVGDNGAGKSTFVKVIGGVYSPDEGHLVAAGQELRALTPRQARDHGIEIVYQDLALCDNLTAGENVVLGQEPTRRGFLGLKRVDRQKTNALARERIEGLGARLPDWDTPLRRLSGGQRQAIAIARATISGHRLVVLDEPTAALGISQTAATLDLVRNLAARGVGVLLIMHNMDQIFEVSDRIVVLRQGAVTLDARVEDTSKEEVVARMLGVAFDGSAGR